MNPYEALYTQQPPLVASYLASISRVHAVNNILHNWESILHTLKKNLVVTQNHMKQQGDQPHLEHSFE